MNLLITGAWSDALQHIKEIENMGHSVFFLQYEKDKLPCDYQEVDGVICNGLFLYHRIEEFTNLKYIQLTSAGFDRVPIDYIQKHKIVINNARGVYSIPMAEFALCGVLQLYKYSHFFYQNQINHSWQKNRNLFELYGKTVCIVGCGNVGNECAIRFNAIGCNILGIDIQPYESNLYLKMKNLDCIQDYISKSDIVILTVPLINETTRLIDEKILSKMKRNSIIVNISRGRIIDEKTLVHHLNNHLLGAVLDVFEEEPLAIDSELWDAKNIIISPHNSFIGENNNYRLHDLIIKNISCYK